MPYTDEQVQAIANHLRGTPEMIEGAIIALDLDVDGVVNPDDIDDVETRLGNENINLERCEGCYWWYDAFDLVAEDGEEVEEGEDTGYCVDCRTH